MYEGVCKPYFHILFYNTSDNQMKNGLDFTG
uniref:Uncharacterized protein n=1 Tax=Anguilla anguilla TaxID=7936 RepID=A0A0E9T0U1_ANGAN